MIMIVPPYEDQGPDSQTM